MFKRISLISVLVLVAVAGCRHDRPLVSPAPKGAKTIVDCQVVNGLAYVTLYGDSMMTGFPTNDGLFGRADIHSEAATTMCLVGDSTNWRPITEKETTGTYCTKMNEKRQFAFTVRAEDVAHVFNFGDFNSKPIRWILADQVTITGSCGYYEFHGGFVAK